MARHLRCIHPRALRDAGLPVRSFARVVAPRASGIHLVLGCVGVALSVLVLTGTVVQAQRVESSAARAISGQVVDAASGRPLADAAVQLLVSGDTARAVSDSDGRFRIRVGADAGRGAELVVRRLGYVAVRRADVIGLTGPLVVTLTPLALQLDATVITAARREQRLKDAVVPIELVSRDQIEGTGASDVASVLSEQLGVQLEGGLPAGAGVQLQGLGTNRVLVLLDGQPLVGRINGNLDLSRLPTANLERIEIIKGPQSTLYGSDAMGGVINLVTRRPAAGHTDASLQFTGGSRARMDAHGSLRGGTERLLGGLDVGARSVELAPGVPGTRGSLAERLEITPSMQWRVNDAWAVEAGGMFIRESQRYRAGQLYRFADRDQQSARLGATWHRGDQRAGVLLYQSRFDHLARSSTLDQPQRQDGERDRQVLQELELTYSGPVAGPLPGAVVDAGVEIRREEIVGDRIDGSRRAFNAAEPFAQITIGNERLMVTPGARVTWNERWGTFTTPRIAARWRPSPAVSVRATFGRGFRAPDFKELYLAFANAQVGYAVVGNLELRPETSTSTQVNVEYAGDRYYARAGVYDNQLKDFIEFEETSLLGTYSYGNVASARTRGVETEFGLTAGRLRLETGGTYLDARDTRTGLLLLGRPRVSGRVSASAGRLLGARLSATLLYTGETPTQRAVDGAVTSTQPDFTRLDMRLARTIGSGVQLSLGVDNAFNRQLDLAWPGFTGRQWYGGVTWTPLGGAR